MLLGRICSDKICPLGGSFWPKYNGWIGKGKTRDGKDNYTTCFTNIDAGSSDNVDRSKLKQNYENQLIKNGTKLVNMS